MEDVKEEFFKTKLRKSGNSWTITCPPISIECLDANEDYIMNVRLSIFKKSDGVKKLKKKKDDG